MSFLSRPKRLVSASARRLDGVLAAIARLGVGAFGWPIVIGMGLATGAFGILRPKFAQAGLLRRSTMEFMRPVLGAVAVATLATFATALAVAFIRRRRSGAPLLETYRGVLARGAFLSALPLVVLLVTRSTPDREWFALALTLVAAALGAYSAYHVFRSRGERPPGRAARAVAAGTVVVAAVAYAVQMARAGIGNHLRFNTGRADLGVYVSMFREASEGRIFSCSLCGSGSHPYAHFEPIVALLSPLYRIYPAAQTLIVLGCVLVASGAVPLYLLARRQLTEGASAALALSYLSYPALSEVVLFDFHSVALAIPVALWLLYAFERRAMAAYWTLAFVLLLLREDMGFVLATVGLYVLFSGGPSGRRLAAGTLALSAFGLCVAHFATGGRVTEAFTSVASAFTTGPRRAPRPALFSELPMAVAERLFAEKKALHFAELLGPLLALPLVGRGRVLLLYGGLMTVLAAAPFPATPNAHEAALLIPFLFVLTAGALGRIRRSELAAGEVSPEALAQALAVGVLSASFLAGMSIGGLGNNSGFRAGPRAVERNPSAEQIAQDERLRKLSASWPRGTKVAASSALLPHLGGASHLYTLDDRARSDYVVASMKQRMVERRLEAEESSHELTPAESVGDVRVYRARYHHRMSPKQRQIDDE